MVLYTNAHRYIQLYIECLQADLDLCSKGSKRLCYYENVLKPNSGLPSEYKRKHTVLLTISLIAWYTSIRRTAVLLICWHKPIINEQTLSPVSSSLLIFSMTGCKAWLYLHYLEISILLTFQFQLRPWLIFQAKTACIWTATKRVNRLVKQISVRFLNSFILLLELLPSCTDPLMELTTGP